MFADGGAAIVPLEPGETGEQRLRAGGHVRLRGPNGGGLAATLKRAGTDEPAWTSRVLRDGDWFACLPLRPGRYRLDNRITQAAMEVIVRYPDPRVPRDPLGRTAPVHVQAGEGFQQSMVEFFPGQPLIVAVLARRISCWRWRRRTMGRPILRLGGRRPMPTRSRLSAHAVARAAVPDSAGDLPEPAFNLDARAELVGMLSFFFLPWLRGTKKKQGFDKLGPNGVRYAMECS